MISLRSIARAATVLGALSLAAGCSFHVSSSNSSRPRPTNGKPARQSTSSGKSARPNGKAANPSSNSGGKSASGGKTPTTTPTKGDNGGKQPAAQPTGGAKRHAVGNSATSKSRPVDPADPTPKRTTEPKRVSEPRRVPTKGSNTKAVGGMKTKTKTTQPQPGSKTIKAKE